MEQRRMDYHLHTLHSFDGDQSVEELCRTMVRLGVQEICLTEHIEPGHPDPECDVPPIWDLYLNDIAYARRAFPTLTIRAGVEIGDNPACRKQIKKSLQGLDLDFHLLSLHLVNGIDPYDAKHFYTGKTRAQAYREYAEAKAASILAWDDFDSIAHIGYVSRYSSYEDQPLLYTDAPDAFDAIFRHIIDLGRCLEINTNGRKETGFDLPHPSLIRRYIELGGEDFTFGSDAHRVGRAYENIENARELVRSLGGKYQCSFDRHVKTRWAL